VTFGTCSGACVGCGGAGAGATDGTTTGAVVVLFGSTVVGCGGGAFVDAGNGGAVEEEAGVVADASVSDGGIVVTLTGNGGDVGCDKFETATVGGIVVGTSGSAGGVVTLTVAVPEDVVDGGVAGSGAVVALLGVIGPDVGIAVVCAEVVGEMVADVDIDVVVVAVDAAAVVVVAAAAAAAAAAVVVAAVVDVVVVVVVVGGGLL